MRILKRELIPGSTIFYVTEGIPHTATIISNAHSDYYKINNVNFIDEYEDDERFVSKKICFHTNQIYLPKYPSIQEIKYYVELAKTVYDHGINDFPKRVIDRNEVTSYRPFIDFENGMVFKLSGKFGKNKYYYYYTKTIIPILVDIEDNENVITPCWIDQSCKVSPAAVNEKIVTEKDIEEIYSFNDLLGECSYENIHTPITRYWNLLYKK